MATVVNLLIHVKELTLVTVTEVEHFVVGVRIISLNHYLITTCVLIDQCHTGLIMMLYIFCIIGYGLGLMLMDSIKYVGVSIIKAFYRRIKEKLSKNQTQKWQRKIKNNQT